ncbi:hypothetical protein GUA87_07595 [Sneathiella sp. P13V-1]|uniref:NnrU family protein n=1 Tax=Sneathiella sp. P13V-1 TaxID=2697366 RepID=UPI00187BB42C|nr:NnrU family protein [Sneathiella sp. P13V-1]MBE7636706.1 hypothetical protein [Sneathiella sp. P13V-1]
MTDSIEGLLAATVLFLAIHIIPSSFLRGALVNKIGEPVYMAGYSILSGILMVWMVLAYFGAPYGDIIWETGNWARYAAIPLMFVASVLFIGPFTGMNPTGAKAQKTIDSVGAYSGLNAITRHPMMWSFVLWSIVHLMNNGDVKSIIFFCGFGGLALAGTLLIDAKREKELGEKWDEYARRTSNIPFAAILTGRAKLSVKALWWRVAIGVVVFMAFYHTHLMVIGVSPFPFK